MSEKKDLTRIEDIGEYIHELNEDSSDYSFTDDSTPPTLEENPFPAQEDEEFSFESTEEISDDSTIQQEVIEPEFINDIQEEETQPLFEEEKKEEDHTNFQPVEENYDFKPLPENFEEVKNFAENQTIISHGEEASPSYSISLNDIKYSEDIEDIIILLKEFNVLYENENQTRERLKKGHFLIPRISEYVGILLSHRLRRFSIDINFGLTDQIQPKTSTEIDHGSVSKNQLNQNQSFHYSDEKKANSIAQISLFLSSLPANFKVMNDLGIITDSIIIPSSHVEDEQSDEMKNHYIELTEKMKKIAFLKQANIIYSVQFSLTPMIHQQQTYRLTCTGNLAWAQKI